MLEVFKFFFQCCADVFNLLFSIDLGFMSLGMFLCVLSFGAPAVMSIINFIKNLAGGDKK